MPATDPLPSLKDGTPPTNLQASHPVPAVREAPARPKSRRRWLWIGGGVLAAGLAALVSYPLWISGPPTVPVETMALAPVTRVLAVNGRIAAVQSVEVRAPVAGTLASLSVAEGDSVAQDQILAQVDATAQVLQVRQAVAGVEAARVAQEQASEAYERAQALGNNIARTALETAAHALEAATQDLARQTAVLDQARAVLDTYTIRAPVAGSVLVLAAEQGQLVGPSTALLTLANLADLVVEADVDEAYAIQIARDQPATLQLAGETGTRAGRVSFVSTRVDVATGGLAVKIAFDAPVAAPIGLTVAANIVVDQRDAALTVPRSALIGGESGNAVFVLNAGVARAVPVGVVDWPAARLIVTEGLAEGDQVIIDAAGIEDSQAVMGIMP